MGISKLWQILEAGKRRYSLEELAYESKTRARIAIDIAIWTFQISANTSGEQPELLVMFFRLCRLYDLGIRPVFVFDGGNRPVFKRSRLINTAPSDTKFKQDLIKMIEFFGFAIWHALGEAEAECAMLQRLGFVDLVMTGDSDVFLFGASRVIRQWTSKKDEQIDCYDMKWIKESTGLDRSDLILIGLLRGNDYDRGTSGVGIQVAEGLARARHHHQLMDSIALAPPDTPLEDSMVQHLYDDLTYDLHNDSSGFLGRKYPNMTLDPKFPDFSIVLDFIHPKTNIQSKKYALHAKVLRQHLDFDSEPNWGMLAMLIQRLFQWPNDYLIKRFGALLYPRYMRKQLSKRLPTRRGVVSQEENSNHGQMQLEDFYKPTSMLTHNTDDDLVTITASKIKGRRRYYRVEWHPQTWSLYKQKISTLLNKNIQNERSSEPIEDTWPQIKRQWVEAELVFLSYRSMALEFQSKQSKKKESFLILPKPVKKKNSSQCIT